MMSESLSVVSAKHKIFLRSASRLMPFTDVRKKSPLARNFSAQPLQRSRATAGPPSINAADVGVVTLISHYAPPAIVFNENYEAIHLFGDVNSFIHAKSGTASLVVSRLLLDELVPVATALLHKSIKEAVSLQSEPVEVLLRSGDKVLVRLSAHSLASDGVERLSMLCFESPERSQKWVRAPLDVSAETMSRMSLLERELAATRDSLQMTIEELETSNEELQATNEELMASNEELQSSNEELQSVNEELNTVNTEFQEKVSQLGKVNADLESMGQAVTVPTVFVDTEMHITRFSPDATTVFKLRQSDLGRPLDEITNTLAYPELTNDIQATLSAGRLIEHQIKGIDSNKTYMVRIVPYSLPSLVGRGAVLSVLDVSDYHDARRLQTVLDCLPEHIAVLDTRGLITQVNAAWRRFSSANGDPLGVSTGVGANYLKACGGNEAESSTSEAVRGIRGVLEGTLPSFSLEYPCHSPDKRRWFVMNVAPIPGPTYGAVVSHFNVTNWFERGDHAEI